MNGHWVSEWLLFNANSAIFQLYHGKNKLIINEMMVRFVLDQHAELDFYSARRLKQQSAGRPSDSEPTSLCSYSLMLCA